MHHNTHPYFRAAAEQAASFDSLLLKGLSARFREIMIAAEVLHDVQFAAPWLKPHAPHSASKQPNLSCLG